MHGPCGVAKKSAPCLRDGKCSKKYPKAFSAISNAKLDNRWVVPYNPFLLLKFNAHINVEICSTVSSVKYFYKYVHKGHDRGVVEFKSGSETVETKCVDEISNYLEGRYVSATEARYRIFAYDLHANLPHVLRLAVHLENQQPVYFSEQAELKDVLSKQRDTTLTGWFVANQSFHSAREITYTNFPDKFVWNKSERKWKPKVKGHGTMIGRMYFVYPVEEPFYLRMLPNHVTRCTSFQGIRTLADGTV